MAKKGTSEDPWKNIFTWRKFLILITAIVIITFLLYNFGYIKKTCDTDACFQRSLNSCSPTKYITLNNMNYYKYSIMGQRASGCRINVELVRMAEGTPPDKVERFEGKGMACIVPRDKLKSLNSTNIEGMLGHCSGPLKEAMYEHIIEKLYTIVIANLGNVIEEVRTTI
ncbi:MAG: hypothetical protein ABIB71_05615 [Candidatus Woesearchaeota archaeon]